MARKIHCLLVNIGSPISPREKDVARYLRSFLMDKYILRMPWVLRFLLVNCIIVPRRKMHSSRKYTQIWQDGKSPLVANTENLVFKLKSYLKSSNIDVSFAMRHGSHNLKKEVERLLDKGVEELLVIPMFPQYEKSTYQAVVDKVDILVKKKCKVSYLPPFFQDADYIEILKNSIISKVDVKEVDKLVYSFHGIPLSYLPCDTETAASCDNKIPNLASSPACRTCYKYQCLQSAKLVSDSLGLKDSEYSVGFQSRLGENNWLAPSLTTEVAMLLKDGNTKIAVASASFIADCLETLHEIDIELREEFITGGGNELYFIPCLNDSDAWAQKLSGWIRSESTSGNQGN